MADDEPDRQGWVRDHFDGTWSELDETGTLSGRFMFIDGKRFEVSDDE